MNLSYLVTVHNETNTLDALLKRLKAYLSESDEIVVVDDYSDDPETIKILDSYRNDPSIHIHQHGLNKNYGAHKNFGNLLCQGDWIFQIDADEVPQECLLLNLKDIIEANPDIEMYLVPRINDFDGVNDDHAKMWGWRLTMHEGRPIVNWPDYQSRLYKNAPDRIKWIRVLHEKIDGYKKFAPLPADSKDLALHHIKTIQKQIETNLRYNKLFSAQDNSGHTGFK